MGQEASAETFDNFFLVICHEAAVYGSQCKDRPGAIFDYRPKISKGLLLSDWIWKPSARKVFRLYYMRNLKHVSMYFFGNECKFCNFSAFRGKIFSKYSVWEALL